MLTRTLAILRKEVREILRDPYTLGVALILPLVLLVLFVYALNTDVRNVRLTVLDLDRTADSRRYVRAFLDSGAFVPAGAATGYDQIARRLDADEADAALVIPAGFGRALAGGRPARAQTLLDGSYTPFAQVTQGYVRAINAAFSAEVASAFLEERTGRSLEPAATAQVRVRYNPALESVNSVVPGLFGVILMAFPPLLSALALVREKERGSIQQIFISPTRPVELLLGKLIPYGILAFLEMLIVLVAGLVWFGVPFRGSLGLFLAASGVYVLGTVGIGLLVSTVTRSQVTAMLLALVLSVMPAMLFSGFLFPIHTMPGPLQAYASTFPARYFIDLSRAIALKGQGLAVIGPGLGFLAAYAAALVLVSALRFQKRIG